MNAFADWLFSALFGWMGNAANRAWNAIVNASGGISSFFSKYWLVFVLIIIAGGTVVDYAVWFARWRPHLVWRSWFTRSRKQRKSKRYAHDLEQTDMDEDTRGTLADWVSTPQNSFPVPSFDNSYPYDNGYQSGEPYMQSPTAPYQEEQSNILPDFTQNTNYHDASFTENSPAFWPQTNEKQYINFKQQDDSSSSQTIWSTNSSQPLDEYSAQRMNDQQLDSNYAYQSDSFDTSVNQTFDGYQPVHEAEPNHQNTYDERMPESSRQRRTQRSRKSGGTRKLFNSIKERMEQSDDQESMLDGLPSPVKQEDAFHQAVYPQSYHYQDVPRTENDEKFDNN